MERITIIKDSREPKDKYKFYHYEDVFVLVDNLDVGDYSVMSKGISYEEEFMLERKTEADLVGSFIGGKKDAPVSHRDNFREMWERATQKYKLLMIEGSLISLIEHNYRSNFDPHSLLGSLFSWLFKYSYSFFFVKDEVEGMKCIEWACREFLILKKRGVL